MSQSVASESPRTSAPNATARNFVAGEWIDSCAAESLPLINPATGEPIGRVPLSTPAEVGAAVQAARRAYPAWRETPPLERARVLFRVRELLLGRLEDIARTVVSEHGKTLEDARGSVRRGIENVEVACGMTSLMMGYGLEDGAAAGIDEEAVRQPLGVFAAIAPFNFPAMVPFWSWPYAVACGNTFVLKPSEQVPLTQTLIFEILGQAGFPKGVLNLVHGARATVEALLDHPDVRGVSFVGSTPVAREVYRRAAASGKRVQAQGGAKNFLLVMPDADLDQAVPNIVASAFGAAGQRCLAGSVVLVARDIEEKFTGRLVEAAARLRVGHGLEPGIDMGPVISARSLERIQAAIRRGEEEGARLRFDGRRVKPAVGTKGFFIGPTVFDRVRPEMALAREEIFGPVLAVAAVEGLPEALRVIEASPYGNAASIYTRDGRAAREFRYRVTAGNIGINVGVAAPMGYFPFGGMKDSFFGVLHGQGRDAVDFFTDRKVVITRWF
jgi:malonate-semialdehyde dehydrogenase (acetylating)/methylmalonate-semialdehyde dehydrogenase